MALQLIDNIWLAGCMPPLAMQPQGLYGISYDFFQLPSERPVPDRWESHRSRTYQELIKKLVDAGFQQHQYSDY
ncbi:hypothetical protein BV20DRAFT_942158 [Pilatotrama ljubarskyi]|nr:hypothetical protein BV20DRAFT_942158 [Pilatotrama ljubarskyi]